MNRDVTQTTTDQLLAKVAELEAKLYEANGIIEAIREGSVDALVLNKDGQSSIYSIESADYTYRILIEKFDEGALSISEEGWVLYCNDYFSKLVGIPTNKIIGTFFNSYVDSVGQFQQLKNDLKSGPCKGEIVLNIDGKKIPVCASLTDLKPSVPAIGIIITDLSERHHHEEALALYQHKLELKISELNQMNTNLEQFIHVISHDIKEPLRKIVAYSSHLNSVKADGFHDKLNSLDVIGSSAARLNSLVDDLVKYAFNTGKNEAVEVDLGRVINEVLDDLELLVAENSASLRSKPLPKIMGSPVQMRQLFSNLIANAIKFRKADTSPVITIDTDITDCIDKHFPNKKFHRISLHDNGIGMDKSRLNKIFMIFRRLHIPDEYPGNGIGLAICKRIMENHLGKIEVESAPNMGSTFHLYFPVKH
jgi:signal transduction histidine kinase